MGSSHKGRGPSYGGASSAGKSAQERREPPDRGKHRRWALRALQVVAVLWVTLVPHARQAEAAPDGFSDPVAPPPLAWPEESPVVDSDEVGYLAGSGTVTAAGDYQYTLPIDVPDGRAGMAPKVTLVYSSRGGGTAQSDGVVGVGWSLAYGGSEIGRCPKVFFVDGTTDSPGFGADDALCLDGQRLVQVNGAPPMAEGAEYRTFRDGFRRIVAHGGAGEGQATSFEVFEKDGTIRWYSAVTAKRLPGSVAVQPNGEPGGGAAPGEVTAAWLLTREQDRSGNAISYHHEVEPDDAPPYGFEHRISSIEYTATVDDGGQIEGGE